MATAAAPKLDDANKTLAAAQPSQHHTQSPPSQPLDPNKKSSIGPHAPANSILTNSGEDAPGNDSKAKAVIAMAEVTSGDGDSDSAYNIQKKMRRAERFGVPVMLSEEEKRNSRAERFGTIYGPYGSHVLKKSEEQKRKARAERFGIAQSATDDEDSKKKARLARFAPALKTDSVEEDRRKARAIRFSQSSSSSMSHVNGKGDIETKPAIAGKARGTD